MRTVNLPIADLGNTDQSVDDDTKVKVKKGKEGEGDTDMKESETDNAGSEQASCKQSFDYIGKKEEKNFYFKSAIAPAQMPGHTGYLTFATLYPV